MKIVLYSTGNNVHKIAEKSFCEGLRVHGIKAKIKSIKDRPVDCDLAVFWGLKDRTNAIQIHQKKNKKDFLVLERGFMNVRNHYVSCGFNGLNGRADFVNKNSSPDRWDKYFSHLMKDWKLGGEYILVAGQVPGDASMKHLPGGIPNYTKIVEKLKKYTSRPIVFRPHPKTSVPRWKSRYKNVAPKKIKSTHATLQDDLENAYCVVTFNSNICVDATLEGIPTIVLDRGAMTWDISRHLLEEVESTIKIYRDQWAYNIAYAQWTHEEVKSGDAWEYLKRKYQ